VGGQFHRYRQEFLGYIPPAEAAANYYRQRALQPVADLSA